MKFKCAKIRNIDKSVCTCEQKIAYNYAFMYVDRGKRIINSGIPAIHKDELFHNIEKLVIDGIKREGIDKKYNLDAIMIAFRQGFETYCKSPFIASDYSDIGKCFDIPYDIV